jgi:hypothetical protein
MHIPMPAVIRDYFNAANHHDVNGVVDCFNADGEARDEGKVYHGHAAIRQWKEESGRKYSAHITPIDASTAGSDAVIKCAVSGNFPGSPVVLRFAFTLANGGIAALEITV